jgi:hypothetical protein
MILRLLREPSIRAATHGVLFVDGHFACFTLEDEIREVPGEPVADWKVPGATAIPAGRYRLIVTPSQRFGRPLPLVVDVPGFAGVRLHPGNTVADTEGCILVGADRQPGRVLQSRVAFEQLFERIRRAPGDLWLQIDNPGGERESTVDGAVRADVVAGA